MPSRDQTSTSTRTFDAVRGRKKIVLFHPPRQPGQYLTEGRLPLEVLSVAALPLEKGYQVVIVDGTVEKDYQERLLSEAADALCVGITCILGWQVYVAGQMARAVRRSHPEVPLVWGGWFSTVHTEMALREGPADIVVRGQGEIGFMELVEALHRGRSPYGLDGISYLAGEEVVNNPERPIADLNQLPPMPYQLLDFEPYFKSDTNVRWRSFLARSLGSAAWDLDLRILYYFSSYGCPEPCTFCTSPGVTGRRWTAIDPERILDEYQEWSSRVGVNVLQFVDANFTVNPKRIQRFCDEILDRGLKISWGCFSEVKHVASWSDDLLMKMARSGCYVLFLGAESASAHSLSLTRKVFDPGETPAAVVRLRKAGIGSIVSYIAGMPGERLEDIKATVDQACLCRTLDPECESVIHAYQPLPGTAMAAEVPEEQQIFQQKHLDEFRNAPRYTTDLSHLRFHPRMLRRVRWVMNLYFHWGYDIYRMGAPLNPVHRFLGVCARFRVRRRIYGFPVEFWIFHKLAGLRRRLRGASSSHTT
ncbi:MAG: B12-binding domain-containing radical SAM protein [Planctomycetes bacterium]|nr:B12-binding domain-containing radical SAM protein [Planctomycetota bacterium]